MITIYGIPNCDTMKKARKWLSEQQIEYQFHDYKKQGVSEELLNRWLEEIDWEILLNRRGMMWRKLSEQDRASICKDSAIKLMLATPSIIKRPVLDTGAQLAVGFKPDQYEKIFNNS